MRIAIPVADGKLCAHFGHCEAFALIDVDPDAKTIQKTTMVSSPPHQPGMLPGWLADQGATCIIAGGMGQRAQQIFLQHSIDVIVGATAGTPEEIARAYLDGTLATGDNLCDH